MDSRLNDLGETFIEDINYVMDNVDDINSFIEDVKNHIISKTNEYYKDKNSSLIDELSRLYNIYYYLNSKINPDRPFVLDNDIDKLPPVYLVGENPILFDVNFDVLNNINSSCLTKEEAEELLKWTANNTRGNMSINLESNIYNNRFLSGMCGFSQYSSLYPLKKMGLHVTINNMAKYGMPAHAFGTVVIPIKDENGITNKRYLIDLTYNQFFHIRENVMARYINVDGMTTTPSPGLFVSLDSDNVSFSKELMKTGFVEATAENLANYFKPFIESSLPINETSRVNDIYDSLDIIDELEMNQSKFDYDEEEFIDWGLNLSISNPKTI